MAKALVRAEKRRVDVLQEPERHQQEASRTDPPGRDLQDHQSGWLQHVRNRHGQEDLLLNSRLANSDGRLGTETKKNN